MVNFTQRSVRPSMTCADHLRLTREQYGFTLEEVGAVLFVQPRHLERLEQGEYVPGSDGVYQEHILKVYSTYLGLEWETIRRLYQKERRRVMASVENTSSQKSYIKPSSFWIVPHLLRNSIVGFLVVACFSYLFFFGYQMLRPPYLVIISPHDQVLTVLDAVEVVGQTEQTATVAINGETITKDTSGVFRQVVSLQEGVNTITISAAKKFGKPQEAIRTVIYSEKPFSQNEITHTSFNY